VEYAHEHDRDYEYEDEVRVAILRVNAALFSNIYTGGFLSLRQADIPHQVISVFPRIKTTPGKPPVRK